MRSLHTPGPWWGDGRGAVLAGERGKAVHAICEVYGGVTGEPGELLANEALLAAAPGLAAALAALVNAVHGQEPAGIARAMRDAAAVLSKAVLTELPQTGGS